MNGLKGYSIILPAAVITSYIALAIVLKSVFPSGSELAIYLQNIYGRYGYEIISAASFLEALVLINFFIPGVLAVGFGVVFARVGDLGLTFVILIAAISTILGYILDFMLGKFGFGQILEKLGYKEDLEGMKAKLEKFDLKTQSLGFIHPNIGAVVSFTAGAINLDFKKFLILASLSTLIWYILWGLLIFALGKVFLTIFTKYVFILFMLVGAVWILGILYGTNKKSKLKS